LIGKALRKARPFKLHSKPVFRKSARFECKSSLAGRIGHGQKASIWQSGDDDRGVVLGDERGHVW